MKLDLHVHTNYSHDGFSKIVDIIKVAKFLRLDGIAITDHNTMAGVQEAKKLAGKNFIIIPGEEVSSTQGHIIALGISEPVQAGLSAEKTIEEIKKKGGLAIAAHPYGMLFHQSSVKDLVKRLKFDAVETFNARTFYGNVRAKKAAETFLLPEVGVSDAHISEEVGNGVTVVEGKNVDEILKNIKAGKTKVEGMNIAWGTVWRFAIKRVLSAISHRTSFQ